MLIAVDFDHTIATETMHPLKDSRDVILFLIDQGHEVYILTARDKNEHDVIKDWLALHKFPRLEVGNIKKKHTRVIIDDRAIRFTNWQDIKRYFG